MIERLRAWWIGSDPDEVRQAWAQSDVWMRRAKRAEAELEQLRREIAEDYGRRRTYGRDAGHARIEAAVITLACVLFLAALHFVNVWMAWGSVACFLIAVISNHRDDPEIDHIENRHAADRALRNEYPE